MSLQVRYRQGCCDIGVQNEEHSEREPPQNRPAKFVEDKRIVPRTFFNRANVARSSVRNSNPGRRVRVIPRCRFNAIKSASGRTSSRGIYGLARRRC